MCQLFETIRINDGHPCYVSYHQQRVNRSVGDNNVSLEKHIANISLPQQGCHKLRISYTRAGILHHTITPYIAKEITTLRLVTDNTIEYDCKSEERQDIERLYAMRGSSNDILIIRAGLVTDTSIANIAFFDGQKWYTPNQPLLKGTCRQRLIQGGILTPRAIFAEDISRYEKIALLNAMIDFDPNRKPIVIEK